MFYSVFSTCLKYLKDYFFFKSTVPDVLYTMEWKRPRVKQEDLLESMCRNPG